MKPAPPVTKMFFTSAKGVNLVVPVSTGALRQASSSSKEVSCWELLGEMGVTASQAKNG